ncbi:hypothetical protein AB0B89_15430 [Sphaerisporangium sp. NPDC049002]|uniref:hypothetical protein n=1 Tax=unclassified Sphaerisporangium TaxID=2630420 RepID=UPI003408D1EF
MRISKCLRDGSTSLDLSQLSLDTVHESIGDLAHLTKLNLRDNQPNRGVSF